MTHTRFAFIKAHWHSDIVDRALEGFQELIPAEQIDVFDVPGAFEMPLLAKELAKTGKYDAIACAAFVVDGGIYRHDFVARTVLDAMMQVSLDSEIPVLSVVLTPHHFHESEEHHDFFFNHFSKKGAEAANACAKTLGNMQRLKRQSA